MAGRTRTRAKAAGSGTGTSACSASIRITVVTCLKNEGPFILEWIAYHQLLGATDFLFYSNGCTDGTDALLDALARAGHGTRLPNPAAGRNYQMEALKDARGRAMVRDADWVWIADVDEFPNIHAGDHSFAALIAACGDLPGDQSQFPVLRQ